MCKRVSEGTLPLGVKPVIILYEVSPIMQYHVVDRMRLRPADARQQNLSTSGAPMAPNFRDTPSDNLFEVMACFGAFSAKPAININLHYLSQPVFPYSQGTLGHKGAIRVDGGVGHVSV